MPGEENQHLCYPVKRRGWSETALEMGCEGGEGARADLQLLITRRKALFKLSPPRIELPWFGLCRVVLLLGVGADSRGLHKSLITVWCNMSGLPVSIGKQPHV